LEKPNTAVEFASGEDERLRFAAGEMQGWRLNMEDAHISNLNFTTSQAMFGVFDGHGGGEVARYSKRHFEDGLK
jgi:serine/threonine protein phosphatase PrpC